LIATAAAILERMTNSVEMREITWKPVGSKKNTVIHSQKPVIDTSKPNGNSLVLNHTKPHAQSRWLENPHRKTNRSAIGPRRII
jgi:hypothetical protein